MSPLLVPFFLVVFAGISTTVVSRDELAHRLGQGPHPVFFHNSGGKFVNSFRHPLVPFQNQPNIYSCVRRCGLSGDSHEWPCQCNSQCQEFNDCCDDFEPLCLTCLGRCGSAFSPNAPCQCNKKCSQYGNCCSDYKLCGKGPSNSRAHSLGTFDVFGRHMVAVNNDTSCVGRCNESADPSKPCQCNKFCQTFGDCCQDYAIVCALTCENNCDANYDPSKFCQCNKRCGEFRNCCPDYSKHCDLPPGKVTDAELAAISEDLLSLDINNVSPLVGINLQGRMPSDGSDNAPNLLLQVNEAVFEKKTISKLYALHDNYEAAVEIPEDNTENEKQEVNDFLDEIMKTPIMQRTKDFLAEKDFIPAINFRQTFHRLWFGFYSRAKGIAGSSGFEHVFMGELKNGGVSGFHHWAFFAKEELNNKLNYKGYVKQFNLGSNKGIVISEGFAWRNAPKPISSMFIGTSPEFDLAIYTICWFARPNALCPVVFNGKKLLIQTYDITYNGEKYIATAYPDV